MVPGTGAGAVFDFPAGAVPGRWKSNLTALDNTGDHTQCRQPTSWRLSTAAYVVKTDVGAERRVDSNCLPRPPCTLVLLDSATLVASRLCLRVSSAKQTVRSVANHGVAGMQLATRTWHSVQNTSSPSQTSAPLRRPFVSQKKPPRSPIGGFTMSSRPDNERRVPRPTSSSCE